MLANFWSSMLNPVHEDDHLPCVPAEEFASDATSLLSIDPLEGFRLSVGGTLLDRKSCNLSSMIRVNLGKYTGSIDQKSAMEALLNQGFGDDTRGTADMSGSLRMATPMINLSGTYHSLGKCVDATAAANLTDRIMYRAGLNLSNVLDYAKALSNGTQHIREMFQKKEDGFSHSLDYSTPFTRLTARFNKQGSNMISGGFSTKLSKGLTAGIEANVFTSNLAVVSSAGILAQSNNTSISMALTRAPNFELSLEQGLNDSLYSVRSTVTHEVNPTLLVAVDTNVPFRNPLRSSIRAGFVSLLADNRIAGSINDKLELSLNLLRQDAWSFGGTAKLLTGNYKFGFTYDVTMTT